MFRLRIDSDRTYRIDRGAAIGNGRVSRFVVVIPKRLDARFQLIQAILRVELGGAVSSKRRVDIFQYHILLGNPLG